MDEGKVITELDVLYGDGEPWWGFEKLRPLVLEKTKRHERVGLVVRYGVPGTFYYILLVSRRQS